MKKILSLVMMCFMASGVFAADEHTHVFGTNGMCTQSGCNVGQEAKFLDGYYRVENIGNLVWVSDYVNSGNTDIEVIVDEDVDQTGIDFTPIGTTDNPFTGGFNGMGHSITLALDNSTLDNQGLFGVIGDGAGIYSLKLKGYVKGNNYVGALAGCASGNGGDWVNIFEIANEANVTAAGKNGAAIVGVNMNGSAGLYITTSYNRGNITSGSEGAAITGWSGTNDLFMSIYNTGDIKNGETNCTDFIRGNGYCDNCYALEGTATTKATSFKQEDLASGKLCYLIDSFTQNLGEDLYPTFDHNKVYSFTIGSAGYATYVCEFQKNYVDFSAFEGVEAYAVSEVASTVKLTPVTSAATEDAVILKGPEGSYYYNTSSSGTGITNNLLVAALGKVETDGTQYVLAKVGKNIGFYQAESGKTISTGKAYLVISEQSSAKDFYPLGEDDEATTIEAVEETTAGTVIYNLAGQRLAQPTKGMNIIGGKKYVVK